MQCNEVHAWRCLIRLTSFVQSLDCYIHSFSFAVLFVRLYVMMQAFLDIRGEMIFLPQGCYHPLLILQMFRRNLCSMGCRWNTIPIFTRSNSVCWKRLFCVCGNTLSFQAELPVFATSWSEWEAGDSWLFLVLLSVWILHMQVWQGLELCLRVGNCVYPAFSKLLHIGYWNRIGIVNWVNFVT